MLDRELKKGSAELIILSIVETRARHGYEISRLIETRSNGQLKFHIASLYPLLYRLEERGWLQGRWVEKAGQRRRRFYRLTAEGRRVLASQRNTWKTFVSAMRADTKPGPSAAPICIRRSPSASTRRCKAGSSRSPLFARNAAAPAMARDGSGSAKAGASRARGPAR